MLRQGISKSNCFAWACLDFANSGYTTVVLTTIFNVYFVTTVMGDRQDATFYWTMLLSVSYLCTMVLSPIIGAFVDSKGNHKIILFITTVVCSFSTMLLGLSGAGTVYLTFILLICSNIAYAIHQNVTASMLASLTTLESLGKLSGIGWAWGFIGGILSLILSLLWVENVNVQSPQSIPDLKIFGSMVITGCFFLFFGLTALFFINKIKSNNVTDGWKVISSRFFLNLLFLKNNSDLMRLCFCIFFYQSGITAVITVSSIYATKVMGFSLEQIITLIIFANLSACLGAFFFGYVQDHLSHKKSLFAVLLFWVAAIIILAVAKTYPIFILAANLLGIGLGAAQSAGRASIAFLAPINKQAEWFGIWGFFVNCSAIVGPLTYGVLTLIFSNNHRISALSLLFYFAIALFILRKVSFKPSR